MALGTGGTYGVSLALERRCLNRFKPLAREAHKSVSLGPREVTEQGRDMAREAFGVVEM